MSWLRIDDSFTEHPKILALAPRDRWTWLSILTYCARFRTAGYVPPQISEAVRGATAPLLNRLYELHLLDDDGEREGYIVHDWAIYNGGNVAEKVSSYLAENPTASANEVAKVVGGTRTIVLAEVARLREGTSTGTSTGPVRPNQVSGTESGSESGTRARIPSPTPTPVVQKQEQTPPTQPIARHADSNGLAPLDYLAQLEHADVE